MCEVKDGKIQVPCQEFIDAVNQNGRCKYHDEVVSSMYFIKGAALFISGLLMFLLYNSFSIKDSVADANSKIAVVESRLEVIEVNQNNNRLKLDQHLKSMVPTDRMKLHDDE